MASTTDPAPTHDADLARRARRGDQVALEALLDRHLVSTWQLAKVVHDDPEAATAAAVGSVAAVLAGPTAAAAHPLPPRVELLVAARAQAPIDPPATGTIRPAAADEAERARAAFEGLPEGWRTVLWLRQVEGLGAQDTASVLGLSVAGAERLLDRARAGWHEAAVGQLVQAAGAIECRRTTLLLRGYVAAALSERDRSRVRRHLDGCAGCRGSLEELDDLAPVLRRSAPVPPADLRARAVVAWLDRTRAERGPFGLALPGGRPVPPWAERTLAGAAAALVALGITAAVVAGGRGPRIARDVVVVQPAGPAGSPDGESALGDTGGGAEAELPALGLGPDLAPTSGAPAPAIGTGVPATSPAAAPSASPLPREVPRATPGPAGPPPGPGPAPGPGPGPTPPPPPRDEEPSVTVRVGDAGVTLGPDCTGAEVLGVVVGCEPPAQSNLPLPGP